MSTSNRSILIQFNFDEWIKIQKLIVREEAKLQKKNSQFIQYSYDPILYLPKPHKLESPDDFADVFKDVNNFRLPFHA
jgi:hypothetical protein